MGTYDKELDPRASGENVLNAMLFVIMSVSTCLYVGIDVEDLNKVVVLLSR